MEAAAIKMQAAARGHAQRKAMSESKVAATGKGKAALAEDAAAAEKEADADFVKTDVSMNVIMGVQGEKITGVTVKVFINVGQGVRLVADAENIPAERSVVDQPNLKVMPKWKRDTEGGARWYESLVAELAGRCFDLQALALLASWRTATGEGGAGTRSACPLFSTPKLNRNRDIDHYFSLQPARCWAHHRLARRLPG